jgi:hypothetical protein
MKLKNLGFRKLKTKRIQTNESPLLQEHSTVGQEVPVLNWADASKLYDKLSIDGFIGGRMAGGVTTIR